MAFRSERGGRRRDGAIFAGLLGAFLVAGCDGGVKPTGGGRQEPRATDTDPALQRPVAKIGKQTLITVGQLTAALNRQNPYIRMRYTSLDRKKEYLKNMVRLEVLAREAKQRDLHRDPEVIRRVKRVMVDRLMEALHKELVKFEQITDADARAYYEKNKQLYQRPEQVRISQVVVKTAAEAAQVLAEAKQKPGNVRHFNSLVAKYSIDASTKAQRGNVDFFGAESTKLPAGLVKVAFALKKMWEVGGPVKTAQGQVVLMKTGHRPKLERPFETEKLRIKNRLFAERRFAAVNRFVEQLQAKAKVEIFEDNLGQVRLDKPGAVKDKHGVKGGAKPADPAPHGHQQPRGR